MAARSTNYRLICKDILQILLATPDGNCIQAVLDVFRNMGRRRCDFYNLADADGLDEYLRRYTQIFYVFERKREPCVSPRTSLTVCPAHSNKAGSCSERTCADLHFCIFYLLSGQCSFKDRCLFGHDLGTRHNRALLEEHLLSGLSITDLRRLLCLPWVRRGVTIPQVCRYYNRHGGCAKERCRSLHMCHSYILEECKFGRKCIRNHDINHPKVTSVLTQYGISTARPLKDILEEIRTYESQRDNSGDSDDDDDRRVPFGGVGARPKRMGSVPNLFTASGLSMTPKANGPRRRFPSASRRPRQTSESYSALTREGTAFRKTEELCLYHLKGTCRFGDSCIRLHGTEPFLWRFTVWDKGRDDVVWRSLDPASNVLLERFFSRPDVTECTVEDIDGSKMKVDFRRFTAANDAAMSNDYRARRLGTPSSMDSSMRSTNARQSTSISTVWLWYWRKNGTWNEFGLENDGAEQLSVGSRAVEQNYLTCAHTPLKVDHFVLDFGKMRLKDLDTGVKFKVRRRPQFLLNNEDAETDDHSSDAASIEGEAAAAVEISDDEIVDDKLKVKVADMKVENDGVQTCSVSADDFLTVVKPGSKEFNKVRVPFGTTIGRAVDVISIRRVQNQGIATTYNRKKSSMTGKHAPKELLLYYGLQTGEDVVSVCKTNIDCNNCPPSTENDAMPLGKGGYFHVNAAKADKSNGKWKERSVFVVKCLVGRWGAGAPMLVVPPPLNPSKVSGQRFDSCADDVRNPKTFVIFDKSQLYPRYLITYKFA